MRRIFLYIGPILSAPHYRYLVIANYQKNKIMKIKHYRKGNFNFYEKSRERMQQQLHQRPATITAESKEYVLPPLENTISSNNSVQIPETSLFWLDAGWVAFLIHPCNENKRWKMYREILWRYLHFTQEAQRQNSTHWRQK